MVDMGSGSDPNLLESSVLNFFALSTKGVAAPFAINPIITPYDYIEWSGNIDYDVTGDGLIYVTGTVTISSGKTLTINPGSQILFDPGTSLIINGTLNANGTSSQRITFDCSSSPGTWGGIRFNAGSSGTVSYCDIKHATTGITCNAYLPSISNCTITGNGTGISVSSVASSNNKISYNTIQNNTSCGIYITQSVITCNNNTISSNGTYGINCTNPSNNYIGLNPYFHHNTISGNTYGLSCSYCSPNFIDNSSSPNRGYNVIRQNATGISVVYNSNVFLGAGPNAGGYNCLHDNNGYEICAAYSCFISAANTWWNKIAPYLPNPSVDFSLAYSSSVCYMPMSLTSDPNGCGLPQTSVTTVANNQTLLKTSSVSANISGDTYFDDELIQLILLESEGKYEDAITSYKQIFGREKNTIKGRYALRKLKECCLQLKQENDFEDYLSKSVRTKVTGKDELYALLAEFDYQTLFEKQDYAGVLKNFTDILKTYKNNEEVYKHIVFDIGFLYLNALKDSSQANKYFSYLSMKYPVDPLAINARYLLGKSAGKDSLAKSVEDLENELGIKSEIPTGYELSNNYPNPFNPTTTISYQIPNTGHVTLKVFDMLGREVAILADEMKEAGYYTATFDGTRLSSGVYFARFVVQPQESNKPFVQVKKMLMMK
jgi:tetratricopeptide (TPR) repeat protein